MNKQSHQENKKRVDGIVPFSEFDISFSPPSFGQKETTLASKFLFVFLVSPLLMFVPWGGGTLSYFNDTETSVGNIFQAAAVYSTEEEVVAPLALRQGLVLGTSTEATTTEETETDEPKGDGDSVVLPPFEDGTASSTDATSTNPITDATSTPPAEDSNSETPEDIPSETPEDTVEETGNTPEKTKEVEESTETQTEEIPQTPSAETEGGPPSE